MEHALFGSKQRKVSLREEWCLATVYFLPKNVGNRTEANEGSKSGHQVSRQEFDLPRQNTEVTLISGFRPAILLN